MQADLAGRVRARLDALDLNPFEAARKAGLERSFVNDVLIGRKKSVREDGLRRMAEALECDPEFLTGHQTDARKVESAAEHLGGMLIIGVAETGVWRARGAGATAARIAPLLPDPRFPGVPCFAVMARGDGAALAGIDDGSLVVGLDYAAWRAGYGPLRDGLFAIVRRTRVAFDEVELSIRRVTVRLDAVILEVVSPTSYPDVPLEGRDGERVEIVGIADRAVHLLL